VNDARGSGERSGGDFDLGQHASEILSVLPGAGAFTYDLELRIQFASGDAFRRAGVDPDRLAGKQLAELVPNWAEVKDHYGGALAGDTRTFSSLRLSGLAYTTHTSPLLAGEEIIGGMAVFHDAPGQATVGPLVDSEEAEIRQARRAEALRLARIATWELDFATGETRWSEESHAIYGVATGQFVADRATFHELVHPRDRHVVVDALERIVRDGITFEIRYRIIRRSDGVERVIRSHVRSQLDSTGQPVRLLGTGEDVTDLVVVLSPRESEMLMLLAEGLSGDEIAEKLVLSPATVRTHVYNAMVKLGAHTRGQAIATALRAGEIGS
jgi:DNA-binding CsgD family transcriptional regulator/PAS domain-containing protein